MAPNTTSRETVLKKGESQKKSQPNKDEDEEKHDGRIDDLTEEEEEEDDNDSVVDEDEDEDDGGVPVDRGWAWVIMCSYFCMNIIAVGYSKSFGVFFVEFLNEFQAPAYVTSLIPGCQAATYCVSALVTLNMLIDVCNIRKVLLAGSVILTLGVLLTSFAMNIAFLAFSVSIVTGMGSAMTFGPPMVLMGRYFRRRRTIATAFAYSGVSLGGVAIPPLCRFLIDEFGFRGCLVLYGGIMSHMLVFSALCRDTRSYPARKKRPPEVEVAEDLTVLEVKELSPEEAERARLEVRRRRQRQLGGRSRGPHSPSSSSTRSLSNLFRSISQSSVVRYASHPELLMGSRQDLGPRGFGSSSKFPPPPQEEEAGCTRGKRWWRGCQGKQLFDFSFFKNPMFLALAAVNVTANMAGGINAVFVPALAKEKGLTQVQAALLLTIAGAVDFFGRMLVGLIGDRGWVKPLHLTALYLFILGTLDQFTSFYNSFSLMAVFMAMLGLLNGAYYTLLPDIIHHYTGPESFAKVFGFVQLFHGISNAAVFPVLGALKDVTGTYVASFHMLGGSLYISSVLLLCEPLLRRLVKRRQAGKSQGLEIDLEASVPE